MQRFTALFHELDATTRTGEKVDALRRYFEQAPPADAAWAVAVLTGRKLIRAVPSRRLRGWASELSGYPPWLVTESYRVVGDLSETLARILPDPTPDHGGRADESLSHVVQQRILPLERLNEEGRKALVVDTWRSLTAEQRLVFHKLVSTAFRVGASKRLVTRALAEAADVDPAVMAHRLSGAWSPSAEAFKRLLNGEDGEAGPGRPYPFFLAHRLECEPEALGPASQWQAEWKWDGIRAQLIHRRGEAMVWTRGEELATGGFPELRALAERLPDGTVLDGEVLAWEAAAPLTFAMLQRRLNRKRVEPMLFADVPVVFMAYDALEVRGADARHRPLRDRRAALETIVNHALADDPEAAIVLSPTIAFTAWSEIGEALRDATARRVEGVMLKRLDSPYGVGRRRGDWWKVKVAPSTIDAVLVQAERGHGRRAGLFTDYTFAVWRGAELVPVAKAYSGLTDKQIDELDRFIRRHTTARYGPANLVEPVRVFELAFERVQRSSRHKAGLAVRFPRIARPRPDKPPAEADRLETLEAMVDE